MWLVSLLLLTAEASDCLQLRSDAFNAADLAALVPAFAVLPGATRVAWAPAPGVTRWISSGELVRIGRQFGIVVPPIGICLSREVKPLDRTEVISALQAAAPSVQIELLAFGPSEAPPGKLEFLAKALPRLPREGGVPTVQWRGRLVTDSGRAYPVWTRVRLTLRRPRLIAARDLLPGTVIDTGAIEVSALEEYPGWDTPLADPALAIGRRVRRAIAAQSPILPQLLTLRRDIERGDQVTITLPGEATVTTQAESSGRTGETILLRNPLTGRRFPAKVTGAGSASMTPSPTRPKEDSDADRP